MILLFLLFFSGSFVVQASGYSSFESSPYASQYGIFQSDGGSWYEVSGSDSCNGCKNGRASTVSGRESNESEPETSRGTSTRTSTRSEISPFDFEEQVDEEEQAEGRSARVAEILERGRARRDQERSRSGSRTGWFDDLRGPIFEPRGDMHPIFYQPIFNCGSIDDVVETEAFGGAPCTSYPGVFGPVPRYPNSY